MLVVFDTQFLALLLHPGARLPNDPATNLPIQNAPARIELLVATLEDQNATILIPTPALAEFLVLAESDGPKYLSELKDLAAFKIEPFDELAAVEAGAMEVAARAMGDKRAGAEGDWQKVKVDRQVIAIAKTRGVVSIYSDDPDIRKLGERENLTVIGTHQLLAPDPESGKLDFDGG
jgi:predicted nucleic acid-binding protein